MRIIPALLASLVASTVVVQAAAQTPPPAQDGAASSAPAASAVPQAPAASAPAATPAAAPATATPAASGAASGAPADPPPEALAPKAPSLGILDKVSAYAFVDAYGAVNYNFPKPQAPVATNVGGNTFRAFDTAEGFALNWLGVDASYAAEPIGGTIGLRMGPGALRYNAGQDTTYGLEFVKQAYATWKPTGKLTLDFGKWDQPYGSEVADSQLNIDYTRSLLFWYAQPLFFTGLRVDYAVSDAFDVKLFVANGWNNTIDDNRGKTAGIQLMMKPADSLVLYAGYVGGPEQPDFTYGLPPVVAGMPPSTTPVVANVPGANTNYRQLVDFVADYNPTSSLRFLFNADYGQEDGIPDSATATTTHTASWYGANLAIRYAVTDAFAVALRGEIFRDQHGDVLGTGQPTTMEDGTLTLSYGIGNHLALMLDNRVDVANDAVFQQGATDTAKTQFTTTLGVIASTK